MIISWSVFCGIPVAQISSQNSLEFYTYIVEPDGHRTILANLTPYHVGVRVSSDHQSRLATHALLYSGSRAARRGEQNPMERRPAELESEAQSCCPTLTRTWCRPSAASTSTSVEWSPNRGAILMHSCTHVLMGPGPHQRRSGHSAHRLLEVAFIHNQISAGEWSEGA